MPLWAGRDDARPESMFSLTASDYDAENPLGAVMEPHPSTESAPLQSAARTSIQLISYGPSDFEEREIDDIEKLPEYLEKPDRVHWLNVDRVDDIQLIQRLGAMFELHPLALEDVHHVHQRSKVEEYDGYLFVVVRMAATDDEDLVTEQLSLFLHKNCVVTFQEGRPGDCLGPVRERIRRANSKTRRLGSDFLMYLIVDASIDSYYPPLEQFGARLDELEEVAEAPRVRGLVGELHKIRRSLLTLRRAIWPLRDAINGLVRTEHGLISAETRFHLRDCHDHTVQLIDLAETFRELCSDLRELQYANINQRTNDVMRVLTIISTIFMPLSFIASVYGMNFHTDVSSLNMPELGWRYGYLSVLAVMGLIFLGMIVTFWRWGWIGRQSDVG
jgi:magnesium transporter